MKKVVIIGTGGAEFDARIELLGTPVELRRIRCEPNEAAFMAAVAGQSGVDAIALEGCPLTLELGAERVDYPPGRRIAEASAARVVSDGHVMRSALERWVVQQVRVSHPGLLEYKRVLMLPGLNHRGLADALRKGADEVRYGDPLMFFHLPDAPGVGHVSSLAQVARPSLEALAETAPSDFEPVASKRLRKRVRRGLRRADIWAGEIRSIRANLPSDQRGKIVICESIEASDIEACRRAGVDLIVSVLPNLEARGDVRIGVAALEASLAAVRPEIEGLGEDGYLDLLSELQWRPTLFELNDQERDVNRFAFVIHPLSMAFIHKHPSFRWTRLFPNWIVERAAAHVPPMFLSRIRGGRSTQTGQRVEGLLYALGATPKEMMRRGERFTYRKLNTIARAASRRGARIMGLGAFTSVVGDAGITVAHESDIAVTSGNSLTVAATLEAAKKALRWMGHEDLGKVKAMVVGATGSIGAVCARLIAQTTGNLVLVSIEPERLIELKRVIQGETPGSQVTIATRTHDQLGQCDLVVTATSAFGQRVVDISRCKPGAVICDVARPPDIGEEEAALRPDVLVIESGEVIIPGEVDFGYDIGLPPRTSYACLGETALLAMEGMFVDFTVGRVLEVERVKTIYKLFRKHGFELAGLRTFSGYVTDEVIAEKRRIADRLRSDREYWEETRTRASQGLQLIPIRAKGVTRRKRSAVALLRPMLRFVAKRLRTTPWID